MVREDAHEIETIEKKNQWVPVIDEASFMAFMLGMTDEIPIDWKVHQAMEQNKDPEEIKQMIQDWRDQQSDLND